MNSHQHEFHTFLLQSGQYGAAMRFTEYLHLFPQGTSVDFEQWDNDNYDDMPELEPVDDEEPFSDGEEDSEFDDE